MAQPPPLSPPGGATATAPAPASTESRESRDWSPCDPPWLWRKYLARTADGLAWTPPPSFSSLSSDSSPPPAAAAPRSLALLAAGSDVPRASPREAMEASTPWRGGTSSDRRTSALLLGVGEREKKESGGEGERGVSEKAKIKRRSYGGSGKGRPRGPGPGRALTVSHRPGRSPRRGSSSWPP